MHCHAFLKSLKRHLSQDLGPSSPTDRVTEKKGKKPSKSAPVPFVRVVRSDALQLLTSLALTHAHLSRSTVLLLEVSTCSSHTTPLVRSIDLIWLTTLMSSPSSLLFCYPKHIHTLLHCMCSSPQDVLVQSLGSLTDLDLSFSYSSRTGAEVRDEWREEKRRE